MEVKNCQSRKKNARNIRIDDNTITRKTRSTCKHTRVNRKLRVNLAIFGEFTFVHAKTADAGTIATRSRVRAFVVGPFGARACADWSSNDSASHQHSRKNCKQIARLDELPRHHTHTHPQAPCKASNVTRTPRPLVACMSLGPAEEDDDEKKWRKTP